MCWRALVARIILSVMLPWPPMSMIDDIPEALPRDPAGDKELDPPDSVAVQSEFVNVVVDMVRKVCALPETTGVLAVGCRRGCML